MTTNKDDILNFLIANDMIDLNDVQQQMNQTLIFRMRQDQKYVRR